MGFGRGGFRLMGFSHWVLPNWFWPVSVGRWASAEAGFGLWAHELAFMLDPLLHAAICQTHFCSYMPTPSLRLHVDPSLSATYCTHLCIYMVKQSFQIYAEPISSIKCWAQLFTRIVNRLYPTGICWTDLFNYMLSTCRNPPAEIQWAETHRPKPNRPTPLAETLPGRSPPARSYRLKPASRYPPAATRLVLIFSGSANCWLLAGYLLASWLADCGFKV